MTFVTYCIAHGTLLNVICQPGWERSLGGRIDTCVCMAESLCCSPEIITTLLIGYTPIKSCFKKKKDPVGERI